MKIILSLVLVLSFGCASKFLKYHKEEELRSNQAFDKQVIVKEIPTEEVKPVVEETKPENEVAKPAKSEKKSSVKVAADKVRKETKPAVKATAKPVAKVEEPKVRQPTIEGSDGFEPGSRRPMIDPFVVGEKIVHEVSYFGASAGALVLETKPFLEVNGVKSYNFYVGLKTSSLFSKFYSVDDYVETYLSYDQLLPAVFKINVRESGKLMQGHAYFDFKNQTAQYWEKKYTEKNGEENKELKWNIEPYSQNAFSGVYYMRVFKWDIGTEHSFRVADDEKNIIFKAKALEKTTLDTDAGEFKAIKLQAYVTSRGALSQSAKSAFYIWISDDDRKIILRMEAEIKIGKLVSEITEYKSGL